MKPQPDTNRENSLHQIHRWSIEHPYAVVAFFVAVVGMAILGVVDRIPRRFAPYVESPLVGVVTMMPGLSAQDMESYVSKPIEEQMIHVKGVRAVRSNSQDGFSIVTLEFPYGTQMNRVLTDVQGLMNVTQSQLPATGSNLKPSFVVPIDPLNLPVLSLAVTGDPDQGWTPAKVREVADNDVIRRLKDVPDVSSVVPFGGFRRQLQVTVDRTKAAAFKLSLPAIRDAIDRANTSNSGGTLTTGASEAIIRVDSRARSAEDVKAYPVATFPPADGGSPRVIYVRDVASVVDGYWEKRSAFDLVSHPAGKAGAISNAIEVSVIQDPGASSAKVVPDVMEVVKSMEAENPGLHFTPAYDNAHFVDILFDNVWHELGVAILLTALAVLLFLGEWRGTVIAMITVPTSLAFAILMMIPFGLTFNSGTLIGLLLSIGRLVDDSIIDIHAVERHLRMGQPAKEATIKGIAEVRVAVIASTLMIILALVPLLFAGGLVQQMFVELVWPLVFGLIASMLVSFTLTALLCSALLRPETARAADRGSRYLGWMHRVLDPVQAWLAHLESGYGRSINWLLKHRFVNFTRVLITLVIGFTFYYFIGSEMMPLADTGQASAFLEMEPGTSFAATQTATRQLEKLILTHPEVQLASVEMGTESMFETWTPFYTGYQMPLVNGASMMLTLSDKDQRGRSIFQVIDGIQKEALAQIPGIRRLQIKEMGSDVMATAAAPIHAEIYGDNLAELDHLGDQMLRVAKKMPEMVQPAKTWSLGTPEERIQVKYARAQALGLTAADIAEQAYYATHGGLTNEFYRLPTLRQDTIAVRYAANQRATPQDLRQVMLTTPSGKVVPLSTVADLVPTSAPSVIEHDGLKRVLGITGFYRKENLPSMDVTMNLVNNTLGGNAKLGIAPVDFPPGYGIDLRGDMTQMMESMRRLFGSFSLSLLLMYLVLVVQFRSFLAPLQMIASLPLELAGVFIALWIAHAAFSTVSILGIIVLTGMDITTAVLMIDLIMKYRERGMARDDAIKQACPDRLRPILMTAGITMLVMLPVAIAPRTGLDAYQPLAVAVVGGLLVGTILSLFDIPIMHTYVDDGVIWLRRTFLKKRTEIGQNAPTVFVGPGPSEPMEGTKP